jgi:transposase InsO family protein
MCRVLEVTPSGYFAWAKRPPSERSRRRSKLVTLIRAAHEESRRTYGSPRVHAALKRDGETCCENTVARLMRENGLKSRTKRKFKATTDSNHGLPVAANLLARDFERRGPNEAWAGDITYIPTDEGWLYLATTLDLYSRRIVGWALRERMTSDLVIDALAMAIQQRRPPAGLIHHSDRGSQYASRAFQEMLAAHRITCSMSRKGDCYDNAVAESFFGTLKRELVNFAGQHRGRAVDGGGSAPHARPPARGSFESRDEARRMIFEWIEVFYNRQRLHSSLGYRSPADFEDAA